MEKKIVATYRRVSTTHQALDGVSLQRQLDDAREYATKHGLGDVTDFCDDGYSGGRADNRPAYQKLIRLAHDGKVGTVIVWDLSRAHRALVPALQMCADLERLGIRLICLKQQIDTSTPAGRAFLAITCVWNSFFLDETKFKIKAALDHKRRKGERLGGHLPYGYRCDDGTRLVVDGDEMRVIMLIQRLREKDRWSFRKIATHLDSIGTPTKASARSWSAATVAKIYRRTVKEGATVNDPGGGC